MTTILSGPPSREVLVDAGSGRKPKILARLSDWEYIEFSLMRLIAAWGRSFSDWDDKVACHRHIWEQSECVQRLRERQAQFPGTTSNLERPVARQLETLVDTVLQAPSFEDAIDGIYGVLLGALTTAYLNYAARAHPVHDAPTLVSLHQVVGVKESMRLWRRDYRRRHPHVIDGDYAAAIEAALKQAQNLEEALPVEGGQAAAPCGVNTSFLLRKHPARPAEVSSPRYDIMPFLEQDFRTSIEARRLFWCYGYMLEMTLAEEMLRWLWAAHYMPWEYQHLLARHLWDESRHGDSGHSRFLDFDIRLRELGYPGNDEPGYALNMTPQELYENAFFIGMVAETGHFTVKNEAYQDFKAGGDLESAEMMIFDIIDEGAHVQYCHEWLRELAGRAGVSDDNYRSRAAVIREGKQLEVREREQTQALQRAGEAYEFYQGLLERMRAKRPLSNALSCPPRSSKPM